MTIYLIRHGSTVANEKHLYCGSTDLPLSQDGIAVLSPVRNVPENVCFITSGMKRTNETLRCLFGGVPFTEDPRFREMNFGCFEMHGYEELKDRTDYQVWLQGDNERNVPPGGECGEAMRGRVLKAFSELCVDSVIITHGGVIAAIMEFLFPQERKSRYQWQPLPGRGYVLTSGARGWSYAACFNEQ